MTSVVSCGATTIPAMASLSHLFWIIFAFASAEQDSFPVGAETANFFNYELK